MRFQDDNGSFCCDLYVDSDLEDHETDCENYDGAPREQWEVTTPRDVFFDEEYYSGTGELIGDESYIDYINRY